jgi:hypothetical protein
MTRAWPCVFAAMIVSCTGGAPAASSGAAPAPVATPVTTPAKVAVETEKEAPTTAVPFTPPAEASAGEDWLVWWFKGGTWRTRWVRVDGETTREVGEREALVVGDADRLWQIERADAEVDVKPCRCLDDGDEDKCPPIGKVTNMGLRARELDGAGALTIREASQEAHSGDDMTFGLTIAGGSQARVMVEFSEGGYFCGAHGAYGTTHAIFDVAAGQPLAPPEGWWKALPDATRRAAAKAIEKELNECTGSESSTEEIMNESLDFTGASLALKGGAPTITWKLAAEVMYICSPDYLMTGTATSGLLPEAAPIGLAGPLPPGLTQTLATLGEAESIGWSHLTLPEATRAAKVAAFTSAAERAWPVESATLRGATSSAAQAKVEEGRKLTRAKDYAKAIAAFDAAIELDSGLASAYAGRGYARLLAGDTAKAKLELEQALTKSDDAKLQAAVWFNLGTLAEQTNDAKAARAAYEKSQSLRATKQAAEALARLAGK